MDASQDVQRLPTIKRYYIRNQVVPFEEDSTHEFKGHRHLACEEIPVHSVVPYSDRRTKAPVSRAINGLLNAGQGGTVYLGIVDSGAVKGFDMTIYQQDHVRASMDDLMSRYNPPVECHRYEIQFVIVVDEDATQEKIRQSLQYDPSVNAIASERCKDHRLRTTQYCWCEKEAIALHNNGHMSPEYVVEIIVKPWDPSHPENKYAVGEMKAPPVHEDECGHVYFRRHSSSKKYTMEELYKESKQRVALHYRKKIDGLRRELNSLREEALS